MVKTFFRISGKSSRIEDYFCVVQWGLNRWKRGSKNDQKFFLFYTLDFFSFDSWAS